VYALLLLGGGYRPLGHGAYGVVVSAVDRQTGLKVAIKKCPNIFEVRDWQTV
jgi:serine/threonine protein kinase